jgi:hypothetical protein
MKKLLLILTSVFLYSCAPTISTTSMQNYSQLNPKDDVIVYREGETLPQDIKIIGKTEIGDSGFTINCGLDIMIEKAKTEARKIGANAVVITKHILPSVWGSSCHRIKADLVKTGVQTNDLQNNIKTDTIPKNEVEVFYESKNVKIPSNYNKLFLTLNYGFSFRTAGVEDVTPALEKSFQKELGSGNSFQIKTGFKSTRNSYYGLVYSRHSSTNSLSNIIFTEPNGFEGIGSTSQTNTINYYGLASGWIVDFFPRKDTFVFDLSLGYINYSEKRKFFNTYEAKGGALGISTDISYYFGLTKNFKIGPTFSFSGGALKKYTLESDNGFRQKIEFEENTFLSLYRIDLMLGTYFEF